MVLDLVGPLLTLLLVVGIFLVVIIFDRIGRTRDKREKYDSD